MKKNLGSKLGDLEAILAPRLGILGQLGHLKGQLGHLKGQLGHLTPEIGHKLPGKGGKTIKKPVGNP